MTQILIKSYSSIEEQRGLADAIAGVLDGSGYERGAVEAASAGVDNCARAIGRLVELLHAKGVLTLDEAAQVVDSPWYSIRLAEEAKK